MNKKWKGFHEMGYYQITLPKFYMFPIKCKMHYAYLENCVAVIWLAV